MFGETANAVYFGNDNPGIWKVQISNSAVCNPLERFFPIGGMMAEATFEIVP